MADFEPGAAAPVADAPQVVAPEPTTQAPEPTAGQEGEPTPDAKQEERIFKQSELDKIVQKERATAYRRAEREAQQREERIRREVEERLAKAQPQPTQPTGQPKVESFKTYEEYIDALADYKVEQRLKGVQQQSEQQRAAMEQRQQEAARAQSIAPKLQLGESKYDDFVDVISSVPELPPAMQEAMLDSDITHDLYYKVCSDRAELNRIASLSPMGQVKAILALEATLKAPPAVTKTPPPIIPTSGQSSVKKATFDLPWKEFVKQRRKEEGRG